jgi:DNA modification methylase
MDIITMNIAEVTPYERNPRNNDQAVEAVAKSIKEFGWRAPLVVDKDHVIICGHTRWKAAKRLGLDTVPVHVASDLTPEQIRAYRIADNKTAEIADWNYDLLPLELRELQGAQFDLSLLGFDTSELEELLSTATDDVTDGETDPNAVPEAPEDPASERGKVYRLGDHRLMCGDSTDPGDTDRLMEGEKADLYLVDPPYNVALTGSNGLTIANDDMSDSQFREFLDRAFTSAAGVLKPGTAFYIFHSDSESANFRLACRGAGLEVHETLYWVKNSFVLGRFDYHYMSESILYGWVPGEAHRWYSDRSQTNILNFPKPTHNDVHPSMKPVELLVYLVKNSSKRGDVVLDNFGGSGSTLVACEQTGRRCRMMELSPGYCDVIRRRWAEFVHGEGCDWQSLTPAIEEGSTNEGANTHE